MGYEASGGKSRALLWSNGTVQDFTSTSLFPGGAEATAITKESGVVVGGGPTSSAASHVFMYANVGINDSGLVVGGIYYNNNTAK